jgi:hypothetical protein
MTTTIGKSLRKQGVPVSNNGLRSGVREKGSDDDDKHLFEFRSG